jgi:predicted nucleic acid-binding protein
MRVLIDTPIWSLVLRRSVWNLSLEQSAMLADWTQMIHQRQAVLIGPVRQEVLSGVRDPVVFQKLRDHLYAFDDEAITCEDYEEAAWCFNICRRAGVTGSSIDFLLCAVAVRRRIEIFTTDAKFQHYAKHLPFRLHKMQRMGR